MSETEPSDPLRAMREEAIPALEDADQAAARRARLVPALGRAIETEAKASRAHKMRGRWIGGLAAAAAVAGLVFGLRGLGSPDAPTAPKATAPDAQPRPVVARITAASAGSRVVDGGMRSPVTAGMELLAGSRLESSTTEPDAITTSTGVEIALDPSSTLVFSDGDIAHESVGLWMGKAMFHVPPGDRSRTFSVRTPDAVVTVHGTRFSVEAGPPARVHVVEGVVSVVGAGPEVELRAGQSWSSRGGLEVGPTSRPSASAPAPSAPSASARPAESDLARQNALYETAMAAKRRGDDDAVITALGTLLTRWPDSPLAEEARRERASAAARQKP